MSSRIKMTQESVTTLKNLANKLNESTETIKTAKTKLESSFEEKKELLGPHTGEIKQILDTVSETQDQGHASVVKLQAKLVKSAAKLKTILDRGLA